MKRIWIIVFGDFVLFWLFLFLILLAKYGNSGSITTILSEHLLPFTILYISWVFIFHLFGLYDLFTIKPTIPYLHRFGFSLIVAFILGILIFYFVPFFKITPKTILLSQVVSFGIGSFILRRFFYKIYSKQFLKQVILIGEKNNYIELISKIEENPQLGLRISFCTSNLSDILEKNPEIKNSIFIIDSSLNKISPKTLALFYSNGNEILNFIEAYEKYLYKIPVNHISQSWITENIKNKKNIAYLSTSRIIDIIFSLIILVITSPILLIIMIGRLIEDGRPIFIKQKRIGLNGKIFNFYKIRSMVALSPDGSAETNGPVWDTGKDDPRITPFGKVIRKLHVDEIPQMFNILRGDISLVGPRPERPEFVEKLEGVVPYYEIRHIIKPGFTGWAQIKYRYARTIKESREKFEYDLYYLKNRNIFMDLGILLRTIQIIFTH